VLARAPFLAQKCPGCYPGLSPLTAPPCHPETTTRRREAPAARAGNPSGEREAPSSWLIEVRIRQLSWALAVQDARNPATRLTRRTQQGGGRRELAASRILLHYRPWNVSAVLTPGPKTSCTTRAVPMSRRSPGFSLWIDDMGELHSPTSPVLSLVIRPEHLPTRPNKGAGLQLCHHAMRFTDISDSATQRPTTPRPGTATRFRGGWKSLGVGASSAGPGAANGPGGRDAMQTISKACMAWHGMALAWRRGIAMPLIGQPCLSQRSGARLMYLVHSTQYPAPLARSGARVGLCQVETTREIPRSPFLAPQAAGAAGKRCCGVIGSRNAGIVDMQTAL
jgi:hypothetical protein